MKPKISLGRIPFIVVFVGTAIANLSMISIAVCFYVRRIPPPQTIGCFFINYWLAAAIGSIVLWFILGIVFEPNKILRKASIILGITMTIIFLSSLMLFKSYILVITIGIFIYVLLGFAWRLFRNAGI